MTIHIALLRAVNVGGTGKLPMSDLKAMCEDAGFTSVRTYIASGNVVFESGVAEAGIKAALEERLEVYAGKPVGILVRTATEIRAVLADNPFSDKAPSHTVAIFLDTPPPADTLAPSRTTQPLPYTPPTPRPISPIYPSPRTPSRTTSYPLDHSLYSQTHPPHPN